MLEDVGAIRDLQDLPHVLFDQQHGQVQQSQAVDDTHDFFNDFWREAQTRFVHQQQFGFAHQCATNGDHLLFTARERPGKQFALLEQAWKKVIHFLEVGLFARFGARQKRTHLKVFLDAHRRKKLPTHRHVRHAEVGQFVR